MKYDWYLFCILWPSAHEGILQCMQDTLKPKQNVRLAEVVENELKRLRRQQINKYSRTMKRPKNKQLQTYSCWAIIHRCMQENAHSAASCMHSREKCHFVLSGHTSALQSYPSKDASLFCASAERKCYTLDVPEHLYPLCREPWRKDVIREHLAIK